MLRCSFIAVLLALIAGAVQAAPLPADPDSDAAPQYSIVVLQGLNKVTGHVSKLEGPVGTIMRFGNLEIVAHRCWQSSPDESPENAALLEISQLKPGEAPQRIFLGWMFSSSPALSSLENPVYDISILACKTQSTFEKSVQSEKKGAKKPAVKPAH